MKTKLLITLLLTAAVPALLHAQGGSLTPPAGPPGPTMKSLDLVEARIPLVDGSPGVAIDGNGSITISQPGSYYLTGNRTYTASTTGILILSTDVTLDLNGFALINTAGSGTAILIQAGNVTIRNGMIRGGTTYNGTSFTEAGWGYGIDTDGPYPNLLAQDISVTGTRNGGISLNGEGSRIDRCSVHTVGGVGLGASSIFYSSARKTDFSAIITSNGSDVGAVIGCHGESVSTGSGSGIQTLLGSVSDSVGISVAGAGITAAQVSNSRGISSSNRGISASVITNSRGISNSDEGIFASTVSNSWGTSTSGVGIVASGTASFCRGNSSSGNAIEAPIAIGCTSGGGAIVSAQKHLGTP